MHAILILRLYGLYGSKKMLYMLVLLLSLALGAEIYIAVMFSPDFAEIGLGPGIGNVCVTESTIRMSYVWYRGTTGRIIAI